MKQRFDVAEAAGLYRVTYPDGKEGVETTLALVDQHGSLEAIRKKDGYQLQRLREVESYRKPLRDSHGHWVTVGEVTVVRQRRINPHYLAAFLRSSAGQLQIDRFITGATGQLHLYPRDVAKLWVPILPDDQQAEFEEFAIQAARCRIRAANLLDAAKRAVEIAIEDSETAALQHLASFDLPANIAS